MRCYWCGNDYTWEQLAGKQIKSAQDVPLWDDLWGELDTLMQKHIIDAHLVDLTTQAIKGKAPP